MLNRRPSRIEVKPEDRQEEVRAMMMMTTMMLMMRTTTRTFARSSRSRAFIRSLLSLSLSILNLSFLLVLFALTLSSLFSLSLIEQRQQYDELRKAHVEQLKQQIALQGSSLDDEDNIDVHHLLLQRPTTDERIGFIPPPSSQHQQRRQQ